MLQIVYLQRGGIYLTIVLIRLPEDLSPFMYEVPRCFGPYESFLKLVISVVGWLLYRVLIVCVFLTHAKLGVRETPLPADYGQFLEDLRVEAGMQPLNPNEIKAVTAIVTVR